MDLIQKNFRQWAGAILGEFEDFAWTDDRGATQTLSRKRMADLLKCDPATIANWIDGNTCMDTGKLALLFATFPSQVVEYVANYLTGLRPDAKAHSTLRAQVEISRRISAVATSAATLVADNVEAIEDGRYDEAEKIALKKTAAEVRTQIDQMERAIDAAPG